MDFSFTEEQEALRESAQAFLKDNSSSEQVRRAMQTEDGFDAATWQRISAEMGWAAITIPEQYGGLGLTQIELVALIETMGGALLCSPFFASVCLAANALVIGGSEQQKQDLLPSLAAGETSATVAYTEANGRADAAAIEATVVKSEDGYTINGSKTYVVDGHTADLLIVAARSVGSSGTEGLSLFAVAAETPGITRNYLATMDQTRKQAEITLDNVTVPAAALVGDEGGGWQVLRPTLDLAAIALAAEQVGGAQRCLDMTVEYAKERIQFGRVIGSFQAIKHKCADMLLKVESARSAAYYAGWAAATGDPELSVLASLAKAYCSEAYFHCAAESLQIHGGVGFTWEYDVHLHFKRAKAGEQLLGTPAYHRELVAQQIGL
jgi:alkylation response protein AidB-like acyl-CoA dehydrogenase